MKQTDKEVITIIADQLMVEFPGTKRADAFEKAGRLFKIMNLRWTKVEIDNAKKVLTRILQEID